jgi:hypothetical protein
MYSTLSLPFSATLNTSGDGFWSIEKRAVTATKLELLILELDDDDQDEEPFGELRVFFDTKTWDPDKYGLIYTDHQFLRDLRDAFRREGLSPDVDYSEQGMQGDDYVSLDVGGEFIDSFHSKLGM